MKKSHPIWHNFLLYIVFIFYIVILVAILFRAKHAVRVVKLVPFGTIIDFLSRDAVSYIFIISNLLGNVVLFIPLGIYLELFNPDKEMKVNVFWGFLVSLIVEIIQYIGKLGVGDIDDVILNSLGGYIGVVIYRKLLLKYKEKEKVKNIIEIMALITAIISFPILMYYRKKI